ncbi:MAG: hypothetical protein QY326_07290 [Bdellovibrionota bacterium]|nr:MAG: hypothetical protein QY326_07290 [Bdellovibrionota bacterium]
MHLSIRKIALFSIIALFWFTPGIPANQVLAEAFETVACPTSLKINKYGLSVRCSEPFSAILNPPEPALAAFLVASQSYPNANVIALPGALNPNDMQLAARNTVESFQKLGLKDVTLSSQWISSTWGIPHLRQHVHYTMGDEPFSAAIALVPFADEHLVFTVIFEGRVSRKRAQSTVDTFTLSHAEWKASPVGGAGKPSDPWYQYLWLILLVPFLVMGYRLLRGFAHRREA